MKLIKRIGAIILTVAMLSTLLVFVPNNVVSNVNALAGAGPQGYTEHIYEGCDLSFYNVGSDGWSESDADYSLVDFDKMKADGCDFVILRLGSEDSSGRYYDPHFITYYNMAREADLDIGIYFYSYALTYDEAVADAEFCIDVMESYNMYFEYPIYIDIEESDQMSTSIAPVISQGWCDTMIAAGYFPGIYGNYNLYENLTTTIKQTYDLWLAYVTSNTSISDYNPSNYNISEDCSMWQYSFYGYEYDGIGLDMLDVNVSYKDYPAIMAQYGYNNVSGGGSTIPESYKPTVDAEGNYTFENAYGYEFEIDDINGVIEGEDATIITSEEAYASCNPNWAISVQLRTTDVSGEYEVVKVAAMPGSAEAAGLTWESGDIVMVVHSADSKPGAYANWMSKVAALTLSEGDILIVSDDMTTVTIPDLDGEDPTDVVISSIEISSTGSAAAGNALFSATLTSINGDASLVGTANSNFETQWYDATGSTPLYSSSTNFAEGVVYDLYIKVTSAEGYTFADEIDYTLTTADGTYKGQLYASETTETVNAFDFYVTGLAGSTTPEDPEDPDEKVISSIELFTASSTYAGGTMFYVTLQSINGDTSLVDVASSALLVQWWDEAATTMYTTGTDVLEEGVTYDLYVKLTCATGYSFSDDCVMTLTTANGTLTGEYYEAFSSDTARAYDFWITPTVDPDEPVIEKTVINSLEFEVSAPDPAVGNSTFIPTLVSVNGDASLLSLIKEHHTDWYTITGSTVVPYDKTVFEALNIGYRYDLYFSLTPEDTAAISTDCVLTLKTNAATHQAIFYSQDATTGVTAFDIYFETETVTVPDQSVYITGFNTSIVAGAAQIFTPDFNGDGVVSNTTANVTWTANAVAKYDAELDAYVVTELIFPTDSGCTVDRTLAEDEIFIAVHWDDSETDGTSEANRNALMAVQVGMLLEFNNIDLDSQTIGSNPTIEFYTLAAPVVSLGASANEELYGIRFGATYNKIFGYGEVTGLGFLLISEYRLGDNVLNLDYASNSAIAEYVVNVEARNIIEYVEGKDFSEYETFTFMATVVRLDRKGNLDDNIVAVPYITYASGKVILGKQMKNSFNGVLAGNSSF